MALREIRGQPGLFRDTMNDAIVNIRELPMLDPRLDAIVLHGRFVKLKDGHRKAEEVVELLAKEIEQMEYPEYALVTPSFAWALANRAYVYFLLKEMEKVADKAKEYWGDLSNLFGGNDD